MRTFSIIKADTGGFVGHSAVHPDMVAVAARMVDQARVMALGYQLHEGRFVGPRDLFADPSFDLARQRANELFDALRRLGPFEPHRLPLDEMEYTTMPAVAERLADRWEPLPTPANPAHIGS